MDFLVRIDSSEVYSLPEAQRQKLVDEEWARGRELHAKGILRTLWRIPGSKGNFGLWSARDADELAEVLRSLPIWPFSTTEVTPRPSIP